jgi:hypothetical protein
MSAWWQDVELDDCPHCAEKRLVELKEAFATPHSSHRSSV